jgi:two-component system, OmpR family, response regulator MprA
MPTTRILVADDSKTICTQLRRVLTREGYEVHVATSGEDAIREIREDCPQLLILDINMPGLDGYEVCAQLKQMGEPWSRLPIIFLTSVNAHALYLLGASMGAYLKKPVSEEALRATVSRIVSRRPTPANSV